MGICFSCRSLLFFCAFVGCLQASNPCYSQIKSEPPITTPKEKPTTSTYSKAGSDSISLIVFGRILVKTTPTAKTSVQGASVPASKNTDKNIKKEKFTVKPSDKLKTNNPLY